MGEHLFTKGDVLRSIEGLMRAAREGDEDFRNLVDPDFTLMADYAHPESVEPLVLLSSTLRELVDPSVSIDDSDIWDVVHERGLWVVCGRMSISNDITSSTLQVTMVWRQRGDGLMLLHVHASHPRVLSAPGTVDVGSLGTMRDQLFDTVPHYASMRSMPSDVRTEYRDVGGLVHFLADSEVICFEAKGKLCTVHAVGSEPFDVRATLKSMARPGFYQIHRSYLVNTSHITSIRRYVAVTRSGMEFPIGKERYMDLRQALIGKSE